MKLSPRHQLFMDKGSDPGSTEVNGRFAIDFNGIQDFTQDLSLVSLSEKGQEPKLEYCTPIL